MDSEYIHTELEDQKTPITIICRRHGEFTQAPFLHLRGYGCKKCAVETVKRNLEKINKLYAKVTITPKPNNITRIDGIPTLNRQLVVDCLNLNYSQIINRCNQGANPFVGFRFACEYGLFEVIKYMVNNDIITNYDEICQCLEIVCYYGYQDIALYLIITKFADPDLGLIGACQGNQIDMINLLINCGANAFKLGLHGACEGGHINIVKLMIDKIKKTDPKFPRLLDTACEIAFQSACKNGNPDIIKLLKGSCRNKNLIKEGLLGACEKGNMKLALTFLNSKLDAPELFEAYKEACKSDNIELINEIDNKFGVLTYSSQQEGLITACLYGNLKVAHYFLDDSDFVFRLYDTNLERALYNACLDGNMDVIELLLEYCQDYDGGLLGAIEGRHIEIIKLILERYVKRLRKKTFERGLLLASVTNQIAIMDLMIKNGACNFKEAINESCIKMRNQVNPIIHLLKNDITITKSLAFNKETKETIAELIEKNYKKKLINITNHNYMIRSMNKTNRNIKCKLNKFSLIKDLQKHLKKLIKY